MIYGYFATHCNVLPAKPYEGFDALFEFDHECNKDAPVIIRVPGAILQPLKHSNYRGTPVTSKKVELTHLNGLRDHS